MRKFDDLARKRRVDPIYCATYDNSRNILQNNGVNKKCDCGIEKTYKKPTLRMHSEWCALRKTNESQGA